MAKGRRKWMIPLVIVILLAIGGGLFLLWRTGQQGANHRYRTAKVERGEIRSVVTATGTINPVVTVLVGSQVSGTIKALDADFNSRVKEGQVIAQIDPAIFEAQVDQAKANVQNAQASLLNAQASLKNAQANLEKAELAVIDTKRTFDRYRDLGGKQVVAQATLDTAQTSYDTALAQREVARAQLESARSQVESGKAQVEQTKAALKLADTNLRYTTIRSPVNGIVISRNVDVGQTVAASLQAPTLFTIAKDLTEMEVHANVSEADVGRVMKGQEATFTVDAYPETVFRGKISEIRNAPQTIQNVVTYDVVTQVENKDLKLKPGMTANVSVLVAHQENALRIPNAALRFRPASVKGEEAPGKKKEGGEKGGGAEGKRKEAEGRGEEPVGSTKELKGQRKGAEGKKPGGVPSSAGQGTEFSNGRKPARVWILSKEGNPLLVTVLLGVTDGTSSEVLSGGLKEGMEVILEDVSKKKAQNQSGSPPPFMRGMGK